MLVDIALLKSRGCSSGHYKKLFQGDAVMRDKRINKLCELITDRIDSGRGLSISDYRTYRAIDLAYEAPFNQTTPTLVQNIVNKRLDGPKTIEALKAWGLTEEELFMKVDLGNGAVQKVLNPPVFYNLLIPVVKAYVSIRAAKLFNDRNQTPLLPFVPLTHTDEDRVSCEIVEGLIETISTNFGYSGVMRSGITTALKYGVAMAFPMEEWYCEKQLFSNEGGGTRTEVLKEGLRYYFPHPTRFYIDQFYPATTINTDTGCEFCGHWRIVKYSDILKNRQYWNKKDINFGSKWFTNSDVRHYFTEAYPCAMLHPHMDAMANNREDRVNMLSTNKSDHDKPVVITTHYQKLIPKHWGLGDYPYPVWHRFDVANDDTIIWASPCAYTPAWMMSYDYDDQAATQSSLALEALPFQDQLGNILTQMILSAKTNQANAIFYDENVVDASDIEKLRNLGESKYRGLNFIPYDSLKMSKAGWDTKQAFQTVDFPYRDINGLVQVMSGVLNIMERVLQMSAQEVGTAAQHYQSAKEIAVTANAASHRLAYVGSFIDDGIDAWKRQLYASSQTYADAKVLAEVHPDLPGLEQALDKLGFKITSQNKKKAVVQGSRKGIPLLAFARNDNFVDRTHNQELAQVMYQVIAIVANNEALFMEVGTENILTMVEEAAKLSGAPTRFKLQRDNEGQESVMKQVQQAVQEGQQQMAEHVEKNVSRPAAKKMVENAENIDEIKAQLDKMQKIFDIASKMTDKNQLAEEKHNADLQMADEKHEAELQRKDEAHDAEIERKDEANEAEIERMRREAEVALAIKKKESKGKPEAAKVGEK